MHLSLTHHIVIFVLVLGILLGLWATCIEPFRLRVTEHTIKTPKWAYNKPIKIIILADPHMIWPWMTQRHLSKIIKKTNGLKPDLVLLLGDYVGDHMFGRQLYAPDAIKPFENLSAPCGVFAVLGNHDMRRKENHTSDWPKAMRESSIPVLDNMVSTITCNGDKVNIAGIEDWWYGKPDIKKALGNTNSQFPTIFMTHNPDAFPDVPSDIALTVAGHTHGGQVRFPFIGALPAVIPSQYGDKYAYGHIHENGKDLFVSGGLGMTGLPIRFLNPPEIAVIHLKKQD